MEEAIRWGSLDRKQTRTHLSEEAVTSCSEPNCVPHNVYIAAVLLINTGKDEQKRAGVLKLRDGSVIYLHLVVGEARGI